MPQIHRFLIASPSFAPDRSNGVLADIVEARSGRFVRP
jgi:hypothetical protein